MKFTNLLYSLSLVIFLGTLHGQDVHFTQFEHLPLMFNPGQTGNIKGTMRLGAIYRDQWRNVGNFYTTPGFQIDAPVIRGFGKNDWVGAGGIIYQDRSGIGRFGKGAFLLSGAYHMVTGKSSKNVWSLGVQYGVGSLRMRNPFSFSFEDELMTGLPSVDEGRISMEPERFNELGFGLVYTYKINDKTDRFHIGIAGHHLARARGGSAYGILGNRPPPDPDPNNPEPPPVLTTSFFQRPFKYNAFAMLDMKYGGRYRLRPSAMMQLYSPSMEIIINAIAGYLVHAEDEVYVNAGIGYRVGSTAILHTGMDYKSLRVGLAYDVNVNRLGAATGFEIGVTYIVRIQKKPTVQPVIFCPRF
jgi:type IX secretion system PorP/SprF family membrane protein